MKKKEFSPVFKENTAKAMVEFLEKVTITNGALAKILGIPPNEISMVKNERLMINISNTTWGVFAAIANKQICLENHFIKDWRGKEGVKHNMLDYPTKQKSGRGAKKELQDNQPVPSTPSVEKKPTPQYLSPELIDFFRAYPEVKARDLIGAYLNTETAVHKVNTNSQTGKITQRPHGLTEEDINRLKNLGKNFKKGIYLMSGDTIVELTSAVDLHNMLTTIIRSEFDRFINNVEWRFEDSDVKTLKAVIK